QQRDRSCALRYPEVVGIVDKVKDIVSRAKTDAILRLGAHLPRNVFWNRRQISAVLLDLIQVFRNPNWRTANQQGALLINLRFATSGARERLRVFAIHELLSVDPPDETKLYEHENAPDGVGLRTIATRSE